MADTVVDQYWCHMCGRTVSPVMEPEIKCPICESGFVEEVSPNSNLTATITNFNGENNNNNENTNTDSGINGTNENGFDAESESESERAFSLWAPIFLGLMDGLGAYRPTLALPSNAITTDEAQQNEQHQQQLDREFESLLRRRRTRSSVSILRLLHDIRVRAETNHHGQETDDHGSQNRDSRNSRLILVDPFNEGALILHGPTEQARPESIPARSFADYLIGPGLDLLLQHLAENDPNRYGTPPAQKEVVDAMPTITVEDNLQCAVCLEDFELGSEAKEMPCKHKFHEGCIHPWLELHSSCPVCRFQMPTSDQADESKTELNVSGGSDGDSNNNNPRSGERSRQHLFPFPFNGSLSLLRPPSSIGTTSSASGSTSNSSPVVHLLGDSSARSSDEPGGGGGGGGHHELP